MFKTILQIIAVLALMAVMVFLTNLAPVSTQAKAKQERSHFRIVGIGGPVGGATESFLTEKYTEVKDGGYNPGCIVFEDYNTHETVRLCGSYSVRTIKGDPR